METREYIAKDLKYDPQLIGNPQRRIGGYLSSFRPLMLFSIITVVYFLVVVAGAWLGDYRRRGGVFEPETSMETAVASVLGLLAFILGFTFSLTWSRFANRNLLVVAHAKTIGLCYMRAGLIPENQKKETRRILLEYTTILQGIQSVPDLQRALARISELHLSLWQQAVSLVNEEMDSEMRSLFVASVNDLIGISLERKVVALFIQIPDAIWGCLLFMGVVGLFAFGYQAGIGGIDKLFQLLLLPITFSLVIVLIADLNSVHAQRNFKVTKQPLKEVMEMMSRNVA